MTTRQLLWRLFRFRPWFYVGFLVLHVAYFCIDLGVPLLIRALFDALSGTSHLSIGYAALVALLVMSRVGRGVLLLTLVAVQVTFQLTLGALLRANLFEGILRRPAARALAESAGDAVSRFRDDVAEAAAFFAYLNIVVAYSAVAIAGFVIMVRINAVITLLVFIPLIAVMLIANLATRRAEQYRQQSMQATASVTESVAEMFTAVQAIKLADAEERVVQHFERLNGARRRVTLKDRVFSEGLQSLIFSNVGTLGTGVILLLATQSMRRGSFTVGDFALFVYFLGWIGEFVSWMGTVPPQYRQIGVSFRRLTHLLPEQTGEVLVESKPLPLRGPLPALASATRQEIDHLHHLEARNLIYHYPETGRGIAGIDLTLERGSFTVVTGRIGAGKTTLLRALLGLVPREAGETYWNNQLVEHPDQFFVPPRAAYVPQVPHLFSDTLRENILLGLAEQEVDLAAALRGAILERDIDDLDQGLETVVGPRGVKLSGGQLLRTAAARMLVREAELLVFDDLSSALDVETEALLWQRLSQRPGGTYLVVSHRRAALQRADHIILLQDGRVDCEGTLVGLLESCEEMRRLWQDPARDLHTESQSRAASRATRSSRLR